MALAACLLLVLAPTLTLHLQADHVTGVGEVRTVALADGSRLTLNAASAIAVSVTPTQRRVRLLAGQAFFHITRDPARPFVVTTAALTVTVTGTTFAVDADAEQVAVAVQAGHVEVALDASSAAAIRLQAGERLTLMAASGAVARSTVRPEDIGAWRQGLLIVDGATLGQVIDALDSYYRGAIWLLEPALAQRRITGVFRLNDPIAALKAAASTLPVQITVLPYLLLVSPR